MANREIAEQVGATLARRMLENRKGHGGAPTLKRVLNEKQLALLVESGVRVALAMKEKETQS